MTGPVSGRRERDRRTMSMTRAAGALAVVIAVSFFLTGCWGREELENMAFVTALALDGSGEDEIQVTVSVAIPRALSPTGNGGAGSGQERPLFEVTTSGRTIGEAFKKLDSSLSRRVVFIHNKIILIGRARAEKGLAPFLDILARFREFRNTQTLVVVDGNAGEFLRSLKTPLEINLVEYLVDLIELEIAQPSELPTSRLHEFLEALESDAWEPLVPILRLEPRLPAAGPGGERAQDTAAVVIGAAVFRNDRMVGEVNLEDLLVILLARERIAEAWVAFEGPETKNQSTMVEVSSTRAPRFKVQVEGERTRVEVDIEVEADLQEIKGAIDVTRPPELEAMGKALAAQLEERTARVIRKVQDEFGSDIFGFGRAAMLQTLTFEQWDALDWPRRFPEAEVTVKVKADFRRTGRIFQPPVAR